MPSNRDQLGQRDRWSDIEKKNLFARPLVLVSSTLQGPSPRQLSAPTGPRNRSPVTPGPCQIRARTTPTRTNGLVGQQSGPVGSASLTFPDRSDRNSRSNDRPSYQAPSPSRQTDAQRTFDRPSRSNSSSSGGFNGGETPVATTAAVSSSGNNSGSGRKVATGGDQ